LEFINPKEQISTANHYEALAIGSNVSGKESGMKIVYKNNSNIISNNRNERMTYTEQNSLVANELQEKSHRKTTVQYNRLSSKAISQGTMPKVGTGI
jgi:ribosomal protein L14